MSQSFFGEPVQRQPASGASNASRSVFMPTNPSQVKRQMASSQSKPLLLLSQALLP